MNALDASPTHCFTVADVHRMLETGVLSDDAPVELIDGRLVVMSPQGPKHSLAIWNIAKLLRQQYGDDVMEEKPVVLSTTSMPEPDVCVLAVDRGSIRDRHPEGPECVVVVELGWSSQRVDRAKADVYGRGGVPVYWAVDLKQRTVTVYAEPSEAHGYRSVRLFRDGESVPLPQREASLTVAQIVGD